MRSLFTQFSALIGFLTFANRLVGDMGVVDSVLAGLGAATAMYIVLAAGDVVVRYALDYATPTHTAPATTTEPAGSANESSTPPAEPRKALAA